MFNQFNETLDRADPPSEISVIGHTSRPSGYIVRKFKDPSDENSGFLPDEKVENDFSAGGLGYEADAFARCLKGESSLHHLSPSFLNADESCDTGLDEALTMLDGLIECPRMPHSETLLMMEVCLVPGQRE